MRVTFDWLKEYVDINESPEKIAQLLTMGGVEVEAIEEVEGHSVFQLGVTPNRSDCLSVIGVAREISVHTKKRLKSLKTTSLKGKGNIADYLKVTINADDACLRYSAFIVDNVKISSSPDWLVSRLVACGVRPVNNVVDATNYVMLETGQPLHAFDYQLVSKGKINISHPAKEFVFVTLDGSERRLLPSDLLICDEEGPIALAGIMGGKNSEVSDKTTRLILESAFFDYVGIRRTSKRLGLSTESSRRFERVVDYNGVVSSLERLTSLICELSGGVATKDFIDIKPKQIKSHIVKLHISEIHRILGKEISQKQVKSILESLGMEVEVVANDELAAHIPTFRPDLTRPIDLIEEVARVYGYEKIADTVPNSSMQSISKPKFSGKYREARNALLGCGFNETVLMSFASDDDLKYFSGLELNPIIVKNPIAADQNVMRTLLIPGLLNAASLNINHQRKDVRLFALQKTFLNQNNNFIENLHLAGLLIGEKAFNSWDTSANVDFYDIKGAIEAVLKTMYLYEQSSWQRCENINFLHPGRSADLDVANKRIGFLGQLHPDLDKKWEFSSNCFVFELDFEELCKLSLAEKPKFRELSKYPFVERDIAIVVDVHIPCVEILGIIQNSGVSLVDNVRVFDVYCGKGIEEGKKNIAYTIRYSSNERTLTDDEINMAHSKIIKELENKVGAILRT